MFFRRFLSKGSPRWLDPGPWSLNWILEFDRESRCHNTVNISNFLIIISKKRSVNDLFTLYRLVSNYYLLVWWSAWCLWGRPGGLLRTGEVGSGDTGRGGGQWTPDSDNRGPRPGARCQVDRGRMSEVRPANQRPGSGTISQSEDSAAQMNNYHIVQGIMWVSNFQVLLGSFRWRYISELVAVDLNKY